MGFSLKSIIKPFSDLKSDASDWINGRKAIEYQNDLNRENWALQNAYNTPSAQMARYKEAGLNPNLIYGQSNTAGAIASAGTPESGANVMSKVGSLISAWYGIKDMKAGIANKQAQNSLLNSQADYVNEQVKGQALENALKRKTLNSIGPGGNPNDPWYYRELKKRNPLNPVAKMTGGVVGAVDAAPVYTVRINGHEITAYSDAEVERLINQNMSDWKSRWSDLKERKTKIRSRL